MLVYVITRPDLHRIYSDASKLAGHAGQPDGSLDEITSAAIPDQSRQGLAGFRSWAPGARPRRAPGALPVIHSRQEYAGLFGPTIGDKICLGDTDLYIEMERDLWVLSDEAIYGGGRTLRDGIGVNNQLTSEGGALDLVITNVTVLDAVLGVVKADVGIKDGLIVSVGKAGNSGTMDGVTPGLDVGPATDAISGEQLILTAGGIETHVYYVAPQQAYAALSNGVTTFFGGGVGPTDGSNGTSITSGP